MVTRSITHSICVAMGLFSLGLAEMITPCHAQSNTYQARTLDLDPVEHALVTTLKTGVPTVIAVTSKADTEQRQVWRSLVDSPRAQSMIESVQLIEVVAEESPSRLRQLGVTSTPTICVIRRNQNRIEKTAQQIMPRDLPAALDWVASVHRTSVSAARPPIDPALQRTHQPTYYQAQASPQVPQLAPPTQQMAPPTPQPPQQSVPQYSAPPMQGVPVVNAPSQPPVAVTMSAPPVYVQQSAPTVVLGPTPPPNVVIAQAAPSMPTVSMSVPMQSPPQMMLSAPQPQPQPMMAAPQPQPMMAAPQPQPMMAVPQPQPMMAVPQPQPMMAVPQPQPMMAVPQPQPMMAVPQPQPMMGVPQPQQSFLGTAAIGLILNNPNLIDRILGAIGRLLAQRGLPRLQMNPATPASFSPTMVPASQAGFYAMPQQPQMANGVPGVPQQLYYVPPPARTPRRHRTSRRVLPGPLLRLSSPPQ